MQNQNAATVTGASVTLAVYPSFATVLAVADAIKSQKGVKWAIVPNNLETARLEGVADMARMLGRPLEVDTDGGTTAGTAPTRIVYLCFSVDSLDATTNVTLMSFQFHLEMDVELFQPIGVGLST